MSNTAISVQNLSKKFIIGQQKSGDLRHAIGDKIRGLFKPDAVEKEEFWALSDINFEIKHGEAVGIIGRNGAGKSTLLKILSRITEPTKGRFEINGRVSSLLEVGTGFHMELTGRENIFLNGTILGMRRAEIKAKFDEIVAFSGVEKFIDTPVKHYSSGMKVRLAFSVAAHLEPEILIVDEVLAVGDAEFQKKCLGKMDEVSKNQGRTVIFVSHNMGAVKALCPKGILLNSGKLETLGSMDEVISAYLDKSDIIEGIFVPKNIRNEEVAFKEISIENENGKNELEFNVDERFYLNFSFLIRNPKHPYSLFIQFLDQFDYPIGAIERKIDRDKMRLKINPFFFTRGKYKVTAFIHLPQIKRIDMAENFCSFIINDKISTLAIHGNYNYGVVFPNTEWI